MVEVPQDTLVALNDTLIIVGPLFNIEPDSLRILPDTILVNNTDNTLVDNIITGVTVLMAVLASIAAAYSAFYSWKSTYLEKENYYYDLIVVTPCVKIIEDYSREFRLLLKKADTVSDDGLRKILNNVIVPEWAKIHEKHYDDLNSRTKNWKKDLDLNKKVIKLAMELEDQVAEEFERIITSDNISKTFDPEELKSILYTKKGEVIQTVQETDPYFVT